MKGVKQEQHLMRVDMNEMKVEQQSMYSHTQELKTGQRQLEDEFHQLYKKQTAMRSDMQELKEGQQGLENTFDMYQKNIVYRYNHSSALNKGC